MPRALPSDPRLRVAALAGVAAAALLVAALLTIALFPVGWFKPTIERALSDRIGRPVVIGAIERTDLFSLSPAILVRDVRVPQPAWAGAGDLARIAELRLALATGPLLRGRIVPTAVTLRGARLALVRDAGGRENWRRRRPDGADAGASPLLQHLEIADTIVSYRDLRRDRQATLRVAANARVGVVARGPGVVRGSPVRIALSGAVVRDGARWPFTAAIAGADLAMSAQGMMRAPLDTGHMELDLTARASDLKFVDAIIEAGLFGTQAVDLSAHVEHAAPVWRVTRLAGTIGRSRMAGQVTVAKRGGRTHLDGALDAETFDPDDFASDAGRAEAEALRRATGPRIVPDLRVSLARMPRTDGVLTFRVNRWLSASGASAIRNASGALRLDHQRLMVVPLRIGLAQGEVTGQIVVDQQNAARSPAVTLDLRLAGATIDSVAGGHGKVTGRLDARALLVGRGDTIRAAVGTANGRIGLVARDGSLPAAIADAIGFDAGRALFAGEDDRTGLRCVVVGADLRGGRGRVAPLVVDTTTSRLDGGGEIAFPGETIALTLTGAPKRGAVLRLPGEAYLTGTIARPNLVVPREVKSVGNVLTAIGRAITGRQGPAAADADCAGLGANVLR